MGKALLVIDMQKDFLGKDRNKKKFNYDNIDELIENVNFAIESYSKKEYDIIYIAEVFPNNLFYKLVFGFGLKGTKGAEFMDEMNVITQNYFEKKLPSAFTNEDFVDFINMRKIDEVAICGIDEGGCVSATAKSAVKMGIKVEMIENAISTVMLKKAIKYRMKLKSLGVNYV